MAQDSSSISFSLYHGGKLLREVTFDRPIINVGKLSTSNLRLDDINVSRKHAVIERRENGEWRVTDLGSTNGVTVNGQRITQVALTDGDRVLIGNTTLVVHLDGAPRQAADGEDLTSSRPSRPDEEIQGLGENTFYADAKDEDPNEGNALEVALLWGETVLSIEHFRKPGPVKVGEVKGCRFTLPEEVLGVKSYTLIDDRGGKFALNLANPALQGDVLIGDSVMPIGELAKDGRLQGDHLLIDGPMRARLRLGEFIILVSYGKMPARPRVSPLGSIDYTPHIYVALSAIVHIAFLVFLSLMPEEQLRSQMDPAARAKRLINVIKIAELEEEEEPEPEEIPEEDKKKTGDEKDELAASDREVPQPTERPSDELLNKLIKKDQKKSDEMAEASPEERKEAAREMAMTAGAAKVLNEDSGLLSSLLAETDQNPLMHDGKIITALGSRADEGDALAGGGAIDPFGGTLGATGGFAGANSVGGPGGPGGGPGGVLGGGTLGKDTRRGVGDIGLVNREITPVAIASNASVSGKLDRETVQQIIRRNMGGIKWCYQDALGRTATLRGKVTLKFVILPNGRVESPTASPDSGAINDAAMLECIRNKVSRLRFPSPKDGGIVQVSYPVHLKTR
ncbi:MAG: AgmX/PglI C-terminal domain-containing protein [Deltaproteobacteria bacterium]|nr:AgmX/PglI C-terminal domain-containing protein [Deltaproteobacteria bacterium]